MRRFRLSFGLVLAFVAALVAGVSISASAQLGGATPILRVYSFTSIGSTYDIACNNALTQMNQSCMAHGAVTYTHLGCNTTPTDFGPITVCYCKAETNFCLRFPLF